MLTYRKPTVSAISNYFRIGWLVSPERIEISEIWKAAGQLQVLPLWATNWRNLIH